tara:strand:- start:2725 stop:3081 length:357 start_codon:yes stop_codon:yes gene_type:complete
MNDETNSVFIRQTGEDQQKTSVTTQYNKKGLVTLSEDDKAFAENTVINLGHGNKQYKYKILTYNNIIYDQKGADSHRENRIDLRLSNASKKTFENYIKYLETGNKIYYTQAQRNHLNG